MLNEFRGLCLFALGQYAQAAAADYAVLSIGPGWDWTTLSSFYPNVNVYTQQLRALEAYSQQHPTAADARFLLAYQYLREGYNNEAIAELQAVVQLQPRDELSGQLLRGLTTPASAPGGSPPGGQYAGGPAPAPKKCRDRPRCKPRRRWLLQRLLRRRWFPKTWSAIGQPAATARSSTCN